VDPHRCLKKVEVDSGFRIRISVESGVDSGYIFQNFEKVEVESGCFLKKLAKSVEVDSGKVEKWSRLNHFGNSW